MTFCDISTVNHTKLSNILPCPWRTIYRYIFVPLHFYSSYVTSCHHSTDIVHKMYETVEIERVSHALLSAEKVVLLSTKDDIDWCEVWGI